VHRPLLLLLLLLAAAAVLVGACATLPPGGAAAPGSDLHAREAGFLAALAAKDAEQTAAYFADDGVLHVANMPPVLGREAIRQFYGNVFRFLDASTSNSEVVRASGSGDVGYSRGRVNNAFVGEQGRVEYAGKYVIVWERHGAEWQIATYAISNDRPEPSR
jgi:ketosteroid isomerase-like protein